MGKKALEKITEIIPDERVERDTGTVPTKQASGAFSKIRREIGDKDLQNPAVGRLLLDERDRLLSEKTTLENFRESYYEADKRASVCEEKIKKESKFMALYTAAITIGGILIGSSFLVSGKPFLITLASGVIIIIIGVVCYLKK